MPAITMMVAQTVLCICFPPTAQACSYREIQRRPIASRTATFLALEAVLQPTPGTTSGERWDTFLEASNPVEQGLCCQHSRAAT